MTEGTAFNAGGVDRAMERERQRPAVRPRPRSLSHA